MKKLIIVGAGGYAKSVLDSVDHMNFQMVGFLDDIKSKGEEHQGFPILGNTIDCIVNPEDYVYFVAIGNNAKRILGAAVLVLLFSKIDLKNQMINKIAASCFAVYLFHCAPGMLTHFTCIVGCLHKSCDLYLFVFYTFMLIIAVYVAAVLLDQIRIWIWHKILQLSIYTTFKEKCRTYL